MPDEPDREPQDADAGFGRLIDRLLPPELRVDADVQLRSRVLVVGSLSLALITSVALVIRVLTFSYDHGVALAAVGIALMLALPSIQRATRSHRLAGGLLVGVLLLIVPALHLLRGVVPDPSLPLFAVVPMVAAFFVGTRFGLISAAILASSAVVLHLALAAATQQQIVEFRWTYIALAAAAPLMSASLAAAYERARVEALGRLEAANLALAAARAQAEAANRGKTEFLRNVSHELRTPLNAISGYGELVHEQLSEEGNPLTDDVDKIRRASAQLLGLINELLDLSRVEAGALEIFYAEIEPRAVIAEVLDTAAPLAAANHNTLALAAEGPLPRLITDAQRLRQILLNLVSNACKFTENGRVELAAEATDDALRFRVRDTGVGLSAEARARIFEPFVQVHASRDRRRQGSGLGLALSRELARRLGGDLSVASEPGRGAEFTLRLPLRPPPDPGVGPDATRPRG